MCNIAIDFAKHGSKYVDGASLKQYKDQINFEPDFMEKERSAESPNVLGQLYRNIKWPEDDAIRSFIRLDYENSILLQYKLDPSQIKYAEENPQIFEHLETVYTNIVYPMEERLKKLVISITICSEAEIYGSNLQFKVFRQLGFIKEVQNDNLFREYLVS